MTIKKAIALGISLGLGLAASANAAPAYWTDWISNGEPNTVVGNLNIGGEDVTVTFEGAYSFVQYGPGGTNYWIPAAPYISAEVDNAPSTTDIIGLNVGGEVRISFSRPVVDPLIALVSWNSNTAEFDSEIEFLSYGSGYWGNGTPVVDADDMGFFGSGEVHGVARIIGTQSTFRMSHTSEYWHGFTIGALGIGSATPVPAPAPLALLGIGLGAIALVGRSKR